MSSRVATWILAFAFLASGALCTGAMAPLEQVRVIEDRFGVPHVYAQNPAAAARAAGYLHARDRLFAMDVARRYAAGTLAELFGKAALPTDVAMRALGLVRSAAGSLTELPPGVRAELDAYAEGVNAYLDEAEQAGQLPPEYAALELAHVRRWEPVDSLAILKSFGLSSGVGEDVRYAAIFQAYARAMGAERAAVAVFTDLWPIAPVEGAFVVPDAVGYEVVRGTGSGSESGAVAPLTESSLLSEAPSPWVGSGVSASNWFVLAPRMAAGGYPILAADPHVPLTDPPVWYLQHLVVTPPDGARRSLDVWGATLPGLPWVLIGHNGRIAWGFGALGADQSDVFVERVVRRGDQLMTEHRGNLEVVRAFPLRFMVNVVGDRVVDELVPAPPGSVPEATLEVPRHGPVLRLDESSSEALTLQWTGFYPSKEAEALHRLNRAQSYDEFREALRYFDTPALQWAYADVDGMVAYVVGGEVPLREDLESGAVDGGPPWAPSVMRDGTGLRRHEWIPWPHDTPRPPHHTLPFEVLPEPEMPHVVSPPAGFVVGANNDPLGLTAAGDPWARRRANGGIYYLGPRFDSGWRAQRITDLIRTHAVRSGGMTPQDAIAVQSDSVELAALRLLPSLLEAWQRAKAPGAPPELARFVAPQAEAAIAYLRAWDASTPTGLPTGWDASDTAVHGPAISDPLEVPVPETTGEEVRASVATTLFHGWLSQVLRATVDAAIAAVSPDLPRPDGAGAVKVLLHQLEHFGVLGGQGRSGLRFFDVPGVELPPDVERDILLVASLEQSIRELTSPAFEGVFGRLASLGDLRWGRLHRLVLQPPPGVPPGVLPAPTAGQSPGELDAISGLPVDGGFEVVDASGFDPAAQTPEGFRFAHGPALRIVVELRPGAVQAYASLAGEQQSGPVRSHVTGLLLPWLANDSVLMPFYDAEVMEQALPAAGPAPDAVDATPVTP